jgi:tetratricopeptide (TPR) repeat protein
VSRVRSIGPIATAAALAALSTPAAAVVQIQPPQLPLAVEIVLVDDRPLVSVRAEHVPLARVLREIAAVAGLELESLGGTLESPAASQLVSVELERRPLPQVLETIAGAAGIQAHGSGGALQVLGPPAETAAPAELVDRALAAYLAAVKRFPEDARAPGARLAMGALEEERGNLVAALQHYGTLAELHPLSPLVGEAHLRSALAMEALGRWADASLEFRRAAETLADAETRPAAHLGLARCSIALGEPARALFLVHSLDEEHPAGGESQRIERALVRARAHNALRDWDEALDVLADLPAVIADGPLRRSWLETLAIAYEGRGFPGEAGRAWLMVAERAPAADAGLALENAARLALDAGDDVGALFVCERAARLGHGEALAGYEDEARARLGLAPRGEPSGLDLEEQFAVAARWIGSDRAVDASRLLVELLRRLPAEDESARARAVALLARAQDRTLGLEQALATLRGERARCKAQHNQALLDLEAAQILESHREWQRAADAYGGSY